MRPLLPLAALLALGCLGCSKGESDLTETDKTKMDSLFKGGIKNPPDAKPGERGSEGTPMNAADK